MSRFLDRGFLAMLISLPRFPEVGDSLPFDFVFDFVLELSLGVCLVFRNG